MSGVNIAAFCSSRDLIPQENKHSASTLGAWIGSNHNTLIYGGIAAGMMEITATATKETGGKVTGIVPSSRKERQSKCLDEVVYVDSLHERKKVMEEKSDIFVVLAGGFGTLDELMSIWTSTVFYGVQGKHILIDNTAGLYTPMLSQLNLMVEQNLLNKNVLEKLEFYENIDELIHRLNLLQQYEKE